MLVTVRLVLYRKPFQCNNNPYYRSVFHQKSKHFDSQSFPAVRPSSCTKFLLSCLCVCVCQAQCRSYTNRLVVVGFGCLRSRYVSFSYCELHIQNIQSRPNSESGRNQSGPSMPCFYMLLTNVTCVKRCDALWSPWNRPHEAALQAKPGQRVAALLETHVAHIHRGSVQNQLNIGEVQLGCQDERNKTKRKLLASLRTRENGQTFQASCTSSIATKSN